MMDAGRGMPPRESRDESRDESWDKVTGRARYAAEYSPGDMVAYAVPVQAAITRGEVLAVDSETILTMPGMLAVLWHGNAPGLGVPDDPELALFQSPKVAHRGQFVAAVVAETLETAYEAARRLHVGYAPERHDVVLHADHPRAYRPADDQATETEREAVEKALSEAPVRVDAGYTTPAYHHNPMEPHATVAVWESQGLMLYDSCPGATAVRETLAELFGLPPSLVRVVTPHAGACFGGATAARPQTVLAAMAAKVTGRPVKAVLTRRQMFAVTGYRTPLLQRVRLGADARGRLTVLAHDVVAQTSTLTEPAPEAAPPAHLIYAVPHRYGSRTVVPLDVPTPSWWRADGEFPGTFALESALDELAIACRLDPIELRLRNTPEAHAGPLAACLRQGAERFGWAGRDPTPGVRREGRWLVGTGVAASAYPARHRPAEATARRDGDGRYRVRLATGRLRPEDRAALTTIAAVVLRVTPERVEIELGGDPGAPVGGGREDEPEDLVRWSMAVVRACEALVGPLAEEARAPGPADVPDVPAGPAGPAAAGPPPEARARADEAGWADRQVFGAQFAEARVNVDTGEVRVPRLLGVFAAGRAARAEATRARFTGAMTLGLSMTLFERGELDGRFGGFLNEDLSRYLVATYADVPDVEAHWIDGGHDPEPPDGEQIVEIGAVGTAAAIANAVHHATGTRVRDLPIRLDGMLGLLPGGMPGGMPGRPPA